MSPIARTLGISELCEVLQIGVADRAGTDHADPDRTSHDQADQRAGTRGQRVRPRVGRFQSHPTQRHGARLEPPQRCPTLAHRPERDLLARVEAPVAVLEVQGDDPITQPRVIKAGTSAPPAYAQ